MKKNKKMNTSRFIMMFFVAALISGCSHTTWISNNYESIKPNIEKVSIIFPEIEFTEKNGDEKEIRSPHSVYVSRIIAEAVKEAINEGNFASKHAVIYCDTLLVGRWIRNHFAGADIKYKQMHDAIKDSQNNKKTLPSSDEIRSLIDKTNDKYVIIITGLGYGTSEETKQFDTQHLETFDLFYDQTFPYSYQWNGLQLQISLVDAKTMEILWYNRNTENDSKYNPFNKDEVKNLCLKLFEVK
jgi:hypothetical protein